MWEDITTDYMTDESNDDANTTQIELEIQQYVCKIANIFCYAKFF